MTRVLTRISGYNIISGSTQELFGCPVFLLASLALVQTVQGVVKTGFKDAAHPSRHEPPLRTMAAIELVKCGIALIGLLYRGASRPKFGGDTRDTRYTFPSEEVLPLYSGLGDSEHPAAQEVDAQRNTELKPACFTVRHLYVVMVPLACLYLLRHQLVIARRLYASQPTVENLDALVIVFAGLYTYLLGGKTTSLKHWTSAFLQIAALFLVRNSTKVPDYSAATYSLLFLTSALSSLVLVYQKLRDVSFHKVNLVLFSSCLAAYAVMMLVEPAHPATPTLRHHRDLIATGMVIVLHIVGEFLSLAILRRTSAFTVAAITLLSSSVTIPLWHLFFWKTTDAPWLASALAIYAAFSYFLDSPTTAPTTSPAPQAWPRRSGVVLSSLTIALFVPILACSPLNPIPHSVSYTWTPHAPRLMPHQYEASYNLTQNADAIPALDSACVRRPLPVSSEYIGPGARPDFHAFDDILFVVFFSHARYDINLDGYREVYSAYFPNILFIGPASREDRGFLHSYDVVVDSYMAEEDISPSWYKLGGRMAHHMLYTAMKDHPCYTGYLWAPFDALLNVPRLMQFPQNRIWYHSPFAKRYISNPAQPQALHAPPPAWVSKQTAEEYYLEANAWGTGGDWWWGSGQTRSLEVCMPAYERMPLHMRQRLDGFTNGAGHLVGVLPIRCTSLAICVRTSRCAGYVPPDRLFLEIALPTALHLILPVEEEMVFVDHWWDQPHSSPTNTSFGDIQDDGFFGPNKNSVDDMRALFADSFKRQGIVPQM
ncbi:hypothetical protein B0H13DRAFT_2167233 [Mycena leptocephala]|nr:hypothetical protein B0H13DRAFT_2167233 [Mycena leptocephala]